MAELPPELHQVEALLMAGRQAEAIAETQRLSLQAVPAAVMLLGQMKWGGMVAQDPVGARKLFERASDLGDPTAAVFATNLIASGVAGERDWPRALARLAQEATKDKDRARALTLIEAMALDFAGEPQALPEPEVISDQPRIRIFRQLFTPTECDYLLKVAEGLYQPSMVYNAARQLVRDPIRTSDGATLHWLVEDPAVHALLRRIGKATGTDASQGEASQVLRYQPGQEYKPHYDYFDPNQPGTVNIVKRGGQRVGTVVMYLNTPEQGGATVFPDVGLDVHAVAGNAVFFAYPTPTPSTLSLHGGAPVVKGEKWVATKWMRENRFE